MSDLFLITGGTGKTGRRVADRLRQRGLGVRAVSRSTHPPLDWADESTWDAALEGVHAVYLVPALGSDATAAFVARAVRGGVRRIVLLSARGVTTPGHFERQEILAPQFLDAERAVAGSGAAHTIVRPGWFMQNFDEGEFLAPLRAGRLELPVGEGGAAWIDADDIADVVDALLADGGHPGEAIELSGPRAVPVREAVALIAAETGRSIQYVPSTDEAYRDRLRADGVDEGTIEQQSSGISAVRLGSETTPTDGVRRVLGREPSTFEQYVRRSSGAWR